MTVRKIFEGLKRVNNVVLLRNIRAALLGSYTVFFFFLANLALIQLYSYMFSPKCIHIQDE